MTTAALFDAAVRMDPEPLPATTADPSFLNQTLTLVLGGFLLVIAVAGAVLLSARLCRVLRRLRQASPVATERHGWKS